MTAAVLRALLADASVDQEISALRTPRLKESTR